MFGILRPCRHRLGKELAAVWTAQLCGLCLALRDDYGQNGRIATNYDGLVVSALVEAQSTAAPGRREAGRCPLRGMRKADVAIGESVRLAAVVSLVLAAARVRDHVDDGDGVFAAAGVRPAARRIADRWARQGTEVGTAMGFDTGVLLAAIGRQASLEAAAAPGSSLLAVTEPTETSVAAAFAHTAVLAGRPANVGPLREVGQLFGRVAHLLDAVEDLHDDRVHGKWNPVAATATPIDDVRIMCDDAVLGIELALADVEFADGRLVQRLLTRELRRAVSRTFSHAGHTATDVPLGAEPPVASFGEAPLDDVVGIETGEENPEEKAQRKAGWFDGCFACDCSGCCCDCDGCCECDGCCCDGCCDCCDCS
ncbi:DUF5685 family protein [Mycolicibacterium mucogenicum]|uniref:Regulatory protein n=1 Tax=Mycolicibacterium mucogenicum TaxID=56689 RepID=A0A1A0MQU3_MYCMU|nr:DUF5685 family protein [Mycolicibacterium mucogenicum]OBA87436.1 hypothetical protein A5642_19795 [Mycolicibacterium mucogenicum]TDK93137.1 hypothetical protein EUA03_03495 [Mycolicibacterium mucogenicum]